MSASGNSEGVKWELLPQAEFFDVKVLSLGVTLLQNKQVIANYTPVHLVDLIRLELAVSMGLYDANSVCWGEKVRRASKCDLWSSCRAIEGALASTQMCQCHAQGQGYPQPMWSLPAS